jgi:hypothetical protein
MNQLDLNKGGPVVLPVPGEYSLFIDTDGTLKQVDSTGTVTAIGGGSGGPIADQRLLGNVSGGTASPVALTAAQVATFLAVQSQGPDIRGALKALFQQTTGLSPYAWAEMPLLSFGSTSFIATGAQGMGFEGSAGTTFAVGNLGKGGIVKATGNASFADWTPSGNQTAWTTIPNVQTKRWMVAYPQVCIGTTPASTSAISAGIFCSSNYVGLGYTGAATNWQYIRGTSITNISDTGVAIATDATGATNYICPVIGNFDLTHLGYIQNALVSRTIVNAEVITNLPSAEAIPYFGNESTASNIYYLGTPLVCVEL